MLLLPPPTTSTALALIPTAPPESAPPIVDRETWLRVFASMADYYIVPTIGFLPPDYRVSCSWPYSRGRRPEAILGQCFAPAASTGGHIEIFISPVEDDPRLVAGTLVHEMLHAYVGNDKGHGPVFARAAAAVGFKAPWTETPETDAFFAWVDRILAVMPPYPHAKMRVGSVGPGGTAGGYTMGPGHGFGGKPQGTRMLKVECEDCGYTIRVSAKWIDKGTPFCCCGASQPMTAR